jgi:microcystin-dependent protein
MNRSKSLPLFLLITAFTIGNFTRASAQSPFIGEIRMFAGNFAPAGWAFCDGQLLSIPDNSALVSILGTVYGGDGETSFALPDLRGRVPVHAGNASGPGLTARQLGERGGTETIVADPVAPAHPDVPAKNVKTVRKGRKKSNIVSGPVPPVDPPTAGTNQTNLQPYLGIHYIIALQGTFPSES